MIELKKSNDKGHASAKPKSSGSTTAYTFCKTPQFAMADLYLSQREAYVLGYATLIWACTQWWGIVDRYVVNKYTRNRATTPPGQSDVTGNGEQQGTTNGEARHPNE